jgi:hypothetical protein
MGANKMKSEAQIQAEILNYLRLLAPACWVIKAAVCNERGVPDILCCYRGRFVGIEVKTCKGRLGPAQKVQGKRIQMACGSSGVARSVEDVREMIAEIDDALDEDDDGDETD